MFLTKTSVPGMIELSSVGSAMISYDKVMTPAALKDANIVVASLTTDQEEGIKFLIKNGFKQIGEAKRNPNTGHMILLFTKSIIRGK